TGDVTLCTQTAAGDLKINQPLTASGTGATVRLNVGGAVSQTASISATKLGVLANNGILLDGAVNQVSNIFAANNSTTNDVKFRDSATILTIGTVGRADCFPSDAVGVVSSGNVTIGNTTGDLVIGNGNAGEVITAKGTGFVRLSAQSGAVSQGSVGV